MGVCVPWFLTLQAGQVWCYELSESLVVLLEAFTPSICDANFSSLCCPDSELQEVRPLCLCSPLCSKSPTYRKCSVNRGWMKSEPFLPLHLFSVCVAWQSSLTHRHQEGHFFYCRQQKIPRLGLKTSNFKYSTDVNCISDAVTFFLHAAGAICNREMAPLC